MSVRIPEGFVCKSTWQVADVRRPLVSASHIIQAGNDLFIGKDEALLDLFLTVLQRDSASHAHAHGG